MTQVVFTNRRVAPAFEATSRRNPYATSRMMMKSYGNSCCTMNPSSDSSSRNTFPQSTVNHYSLSHDHYECSTSKSRSRGCITAFRNTSTRDCSHISILSLVGIAFVLLSFCTSEGLTSPESGPGNEIQVKIRGFLESHCNKQNQTVEQKEFENFISCNPTQAATTFERLKALKDVDLSIRHKEIQKEINKQCDAWPQERTCQKKNFALIQKCFVVQQRFVFYFMLALTDTICKDGDLFIDYWEKGGDACLQDHLKQLSNEISQCFKITATMTSEELDRNIGKITSCIGEKFRSCGSPESAVLIDNLLSDLAVFYGETKNESSQTINSFAIPTQSPSSLHILTSLSSFVFIITQRILSR